jgi:monofunctional biosynthetic peptidoglycan transglycosylase
MAFCVLLVVPLRWLNPPVTAFMLQQTDAGERKYEWVPIEQIAEEAWLAVIAAEDQRFPDHHGIDLDAIQKAIQDSENGNGMRGASTITQQLAKNLYLWPGRSLFRKGVEAGFSLMLETALSKRRILEIYLNVVEFGPGIYGTGAASRFYFRKPPALLNSEEAALLAAVLPNPAELNAATPSAYLRQRQRWIIRQMSNLQASGILLRLK